RTDIAKLKKIAATDASILITGETGTGKGVMARCLYEWSARRNGPFVKCDCAALTSSLIESDLFGHERGAFTGASRQRIGRFELANQGTVFLDELGEMPLEFQPKLLSVIEDRELIRVGGSHTLKLDIRIISATNRALREEVSEREFRADLFHRLSVLEYHVKPLRDCSEDISVLAHFFASEIAAREGSRIPHINDEAIQTLKNYDWPGNIRELANVIDRAMVLKEGNTLHVTPDMLGASELFSTKPTDLSLEAVEAAHIRAILSQTNWKINGADGAAKILDIHPSTLRSRMSKLGIQRD
ncbi:MAG: sigma-54 dependent transcriptional regulator, partial [Pseudomonadota bacterium]